MALKHATETPPSGRQPLRLAPEPLYVLTSRRTGVGVVEKPRGDPRWNCLQCRSWW